MKSLNGLLYNICLMTSILIVGCVQAQNSKADESFAKIPKPAGNEKVATFAGGCFWSLSEGLSELKGVTRVIAGYAGGKTINPSYEDVCTKTTGHAETVLIYYNPDIISYAVLAQAFFYAHDPTTLNRQGPDEGPDYRSIAFYRSPEEQNILKEVIKKVNESHHYSNPVVTELLPFTLFYPAENYHQGYYKLHKDNPYIVNVSEPKVLKLRKAMNAQIKPEFQHDEFAKKD
jgi:peptide-methionine (S)-S-oxide reductase